MDRLLADSLAEIIRKSTRFAQWDVAEFGSRGPKDLDVFVLCRNFDIKRVPKIVREFLPIVKELQVNTNAWVITHQEHRAFIRHPGSIVHLLFYPSIIHLTVWELPSFIASVYETGHFIIGDNGVLKEYYEAYRKRNPIIYMDSIQYHLVRYTEYVISSLIYLSLDLSPIPKSVLFERLIYALRFSLIELLAAEKSCNLPVALWNWSDLIQVMNSKFPKDNRIVRWIENRDAIRNGSSNEELVRLGFDVLELCSCNYIPVSMEAHL